MLRKHTVNWSKCFAHEFRWHKDLKKWHENVGDEQGSGRPVHQDRRQAIRMLADELNLKHETVRKILTDHLSKKKMCKDGTKDPFGRAKNERMSTDKDCLEQLEANSSRSCIYW